ncbi:MAG: hypothetical protein K2I74_00215, partial [Treponemataceae bacterium]|nr:hypothetical protein [Treponemataceae bacterium]
MSIKKRGAVGLAFRFFCGIVPLASVPAFFLQTQRFSVTAQNWRFRHFRAVTENGRESVVLGWG